MNAKKILSVILLSVLSVHIFAQTSIAPPTATGGGGGDIFPSTLPISSQEVFIANAKRLVRKVTVSVYSSGFVYGARGVNTYFEKSYTPSLPDQPDLGELAELVSLANFTFETRNPLDPVQVTVAFNDNNGRTLFEGTQTFKLVQNPDGSFAPPAPRIKVSVWPSGELPLEIPGADWAEIALLNEKGETAESRQLERDRNGAFLFPVWLAGQKNVRLTGFDNRDDGTTANAVYAASTGTRQITLTRSITASAVFENAVIVPTDQNTVVVNIADERVARVFQNGVSPLVQIKFTKPLTLFFYAEHPTEVAKGFWIRPGGNQTEWVYFKIVRGQLTVVEPLGAGIYDIVIDWPTFGKRDGSFGGGKGG